MVDADKNAFEIIIHVRSAAPTVGSLVFSDDDDDEICVLHSDDDDLHYDM